MIDKLTITASFLRLLLDDTLQKYIVNICSLLNTAKTKTNKNGTETNGT
jgi:hypothetical protein